MILELGLVVAPVALSPAAVAKTADESRSARDDCESVVERQTAWNTNASDTPAWVDLGQ